jgi:uncharacterized protein YbjT (DUF2867 family)
MGFDLRNDAGEQHRASNSGWAFFLNLAEHYGWKPAGTLPPAGMAPEDWDRSYDACAGQRVSDSDAQSLADALRAALDDPNRAGAERIVAARVSAAISEALGRTVRLDPPDDVSVLEELVAFCSAGPFFIE